LSDSIRLDIFETVKTALNTNEVQNEPSLLSLAYGTMGLLYEQENRFDESAHYTRRAAFHAQSINATEFLFRWQWQLGRVFHQLKQEDAALQHYRQAFVALQRIRHQLLLDRSDSFVKTISPIYNEYLDVFTRHIRTIKDPVVKQTALENLRLAIEQLKVAEIEDYYQSACFDDTNTAKTGTLNDITTVAIYPVILNDRVELLLKRKESLALYSYKVKRDDVAKTILRFRSEISEFSTSMDYLALGQQLYKIFVSPYEADLAPNDTLVFVAAWMLRTVPMAALYDGKQFLVEKYALVTTPSLVLTNTDVPGKQKMRVLANGITDAVQGYDALPSVQQELESIAAIYNAVVLKNQDFSVQRAQHEIGQGDYSIIHVATHGEFDSDFRKSYILGYDDKITLAALEKTVLARRFAEKPIDLLVLSACQTATGDDRAALGLAGVAVKAGARSALATLWFISDEATSQLIGQFYQKLQTQTVTKAEALRQAQIALISTDRYKHPNLWAPFILIGNWF
jgi:CHAT domain-containing protein